MVEALETGSESSKERLLLVFENESQDSTYTKSFGVCSRDSRRIDLFYASMSDIAIHFQRKLLERKSSLEMAGYSVGAETAFQHACGQT